VSKTWPKGTNVYEIVYWDRSTKVAFECKEHPGPVYMSKQPGASSWFPGNEIARAIEFGTAKDPCHHTSSNDVWITAEEYTDSAPDVP